jgi:DNA-binding XRE family transcriptional regulator
MITLKPRPDEIAKRRIHKGLSVYDLAVAARVSAQAIYNIEKGMNNTRPVTARAIANILDAKLTDVFEVLEG